MEKESKKIDRKNERKINRKHIKLIIILFIIIILILICLIAFNKLNNKSNNETIVTNQINMELTDNVTIENGEKQNISENIKNFKMTENLSFEALKFSANSNETKLTLKVRNDSEEIFNGSKIKIIFFDKFGNEYGTLNSYIGKINGGDEKEITVTTTLDVSNAYDYKIELLD